MRRSTTDLVTLWEAAQRVMATTGDVERATNETVRREWAAIDAELIRLGIPTRDRHGASGPGRAWWTGQNDTGRIIGIWSESYEEAVIELATSWKAPIVWCVADTDLEVRNRYPRGKQGEPCVRPVTTEPIAGPDYAPLAPLF
jgi:hypothetical protein